MRKREGGGFRGHRHSPRCAIKEKRAAKRGSLVCSIVGVSAVKRYVTIGGADNGKFFHSSIFKVNIDVSQHIIYFIIPEINTAHINFSRLEISGYRHIVAVNFMIRYFRDSLVNINYNLSKITAAEVAAPKNANSNCYASIILNF